MTEGANWTEAELVELRLEGLEHLNRLQSGNATEHDEAEFRAWLAQGRAHQEAFRSAMQLQRLVRAAGTQEARSPANDDARHVGNVVPISLRPGLRVSRRGLIAGATAASVTAVVMGGRSLNLIPSPSELVADYRTGPGERRVVELAGGATIDMNTRTSIQLRDDLEMPAVELIGGEAVLASGRVGGGRAMLVAGEGRSVAERARLSARRDGDQVCIACLSGAVEVFWRDDLRRLGPEEQVVYDRGGMGEVAAADLRMITAWQSGTLIFKGMPMRQVVAEINRYRSGKVYLANSALADRRLTGTYYVDRLDEFFSQAELVLGVHVRRLPLGVIILT